MFEDECGAREMACGADDFGAGPVVCLHDLVAVEDVLDGVLGAAFFEDRVRWDALRECECGHDVGFDELVVGRASGEDERGGYAGFVFADAFEGALALLGGWGARRSWRG